MYVGTKTRSELTPSVKTANRRVSDCGHLKGRDIIPAKPSREDDAGSLIWYFYCAENDSVVLALAGLDTQNICTRQATFRLLPCFVRDCVLVCCRSFLWPRRPASMKVRSEPVRRPCSRLGRAGWLLFR